MKTDLIEKLIDELEEFVFEHRKILYKYHVHEISEYEELISRYYDLCVTFEERKSYGSYSSFENYPHFDEFVNQVKELQEDLLQAVTVSYSSREM